MLRRTVTGVGIVAVVYMVLYFESLITIAAALLCAAVVYELCKVTNCGGNHKYLGVIIALSAAAVLVPIPYSREVISVAFLGAVLLFAVLSMLLIGWGMTYIKSVPVDFVKLLVYTIMAAIIAMFGDLAMSAVKRISSVKDFGKLLPGHGGILDRFDSHLFVIAFTVLFCSLCGGYL